MRDRGRGDDGTRQSEKSLFASTPPPPSPYDGRTDGAVLSLSLSDDVSTNEQNTDGKNPAALKQKISLSRNSDAKPPGSVFVCATY